LSAVVLVAATVLAPWPFGSTAPRLVQALSVLALGTTLLSVALGRLRRGPPEIPSALLPIVLALGLAAAQLVPIPPAVHAALAPGSSAYWHPKDAKARAVLGPGWRPLSIDPGATARSIAFILGLMGLVVSSQSALAERRRTRRAVVAVVAGGLAVALYGIVARAFFGALLFGQLAVPTVTPFGPFVSKNHFAGYVEMATLLATGLALGLADEARRGRGALAWAGSSRAGMVVLAGGAAAVMALSVLVSLSRGGVVSLLAGFTALIGLRLRRGGLSGQRLAGVLATGTLAVAASIAVVPPEGRERIATVTDAATDSSGSFRLAVWKDALRAARGSPTVGYGLGAFGAALPRYKTAAGELRVEHAENDYLELLVEAGGSGLLLALATVALVGGALVPGLARQEDRLLLGVGAGATAAILALLVHSTFDFNLHIPSNALLFGLATAIALGSAVPAMFAVRKAGAAVLVVALSATLAVAAWPSPPPLSGVESVRRAAAAGGTASTLRLAAAERDLTARVGRQPSDAQAWLYLAWVSRARGHADAAAALAAHAVSLDPRHEILSREAERLGAASARPAVQQEP
jgi:O-antigen ligase